MNDDFKPVSDLGLMGGMFDPVHNGHLNIAISVLGILKLDEVRLIPCGNPVHRDRVFASRDHRMAMLELAITGNSQLGIDNREFRSKDPSYTLNTLYAIKQEMPQCRLYYIMGQDSFNTMPSWYRWKEIFSLAHVVVAGRPGIEPLFDALLKDEYDKRVVKTAAEMKQFGSGKIFSAKVDLLDISSSLVRKKIAAGENVEKLLPEKVASYVKTHKLYSLEENS